MTTGPKKHLAVSAAILSAAIVSAAMVGSPTLRGVIIGASLGLVNLIVGTFFTRRALDGEPGAVFVAIAAGFGVRFLVMMGLLLTFTFVDALAVSAAGFGFTFVAFAFLYFGYEAALALRVQRREVA